MTGDPNADHSPHSPSDEERLAALRAHSPRAALMDRLSLLEGGIPGIAAYQAALRLLPNGARSSGTKPPPGTRWNRAEGAWEVDHVAAMRLWEPRDGVGLPPREMVDAFLTGYAERTGDDGERQLVEQLYAEAERRLAEGSGAPESSSGISPAEASAVAARYGYGELVETVTFDASSRTIGFTLLLAFVPAVFAYLLLTQADGETLPIVGGTALLVAAVAALLWGLVPLRRVRQAAPQLFVFKDGVVFAVEGFLDPYAWQDVDLHETTVTSTVGSDQREVREDLLLIGPRGKSAQFLVPMRHRRTIAAAARAGGATIG
ncbi:hypothetical protein ACFO6V_28175 [Promicromonospora alba]|uniref:PH (Pleckstrin Homology) domain-containing protein n=1 Tax=Promicromonospora alba TaxID=1616110 RepID=A0ABV9HPR9_9MICO